MNHFGFRLLAINTRTFRAGTWVFLFWLAVSNLAANSNLSAVSNLSAAPCSRSSTQQDSWVAERVNTLVRAARAAPETQATHVAPRVRKVRAGPNFPGGLAEQDAAEGARTPIARYFPPTTRFSSLSGT